MARKISSKSAPEPPASGPEKVGYARVSTTEQDLFMQVEALKKWGAKRIFIEKVSAASTRRYQWMLCRKYLERGDILGVWSMSRIGRNVEHLITVTKELTEEGVTIHSLTEPVFDTGSAHGRLMFIVKAAFDQFEREVTQERTRSGLRARMEAGHKLGRERTITPDIVKAMKRDLQNPGSTVKSVAKKYKISAASVYTYIKGGKSALVK